MLILFDIDGTLYHGGGSGLHAFFDAGRELFGDRFVPHRFDVSGRLDPWIFRELMKRNELRVDDETTRRFRAACHRHLRRRIASGEHDVRALPGTRDLIERLADEPDLTLGLLTGNWEDNGRLKLAAVGFDSGRFPVCAWGDDAPTRDQLPAVAHERYRRHRAERPLPSNEIIIVGDTIHDVNCAKAHGCRCLAVETGGGKRDELIRAGACRVVPDLTDGEGVLDWLLSCRASKP